MPGSTPYASRNTDNISRAALGLGRPTPYQRPPAGRTPYRPPPASQARPPPASQARPPPASQARSEQARPTPQAPSASLKTLLEAKFPIAANKDVWQDVLRWVQDRTKGLGDRACVLLGPCGVGKTSGATFLLNMYYPNVVEIHAGDFSTPEWIEKELDEAATRASVCSESQLPSAILIDDLESFQADSAAKIGTLLKDMAMAANVAVVVTAPVDFHLPQWAKELPVHHLAPLTQNELICLGQRLNRRADSSTLYRWARSAMGDARQMTLMSTSAIGGGSQKDSRARDLFTAVRMMLFDKPARLATKGMQRDAISGCRALLDSGPFALMEGLLHANYIDAIGLGISGDAAKLASISDASDALSALQTMRTGPVNGLVEEANVLISTVGLRNPMKPNDAMRQGLTMPEKRGKRTARLHQLLADEGRAMAELTGLDREGRQVALWFGH